MHEKMFPIIWWLFCNRRRIIEEYRRIHGEEIKISTSEQIAQRLWKAVAQVKAGNAWEYLLKETRQSIYSLYWSKEITKNVPNNKMSSMQLWYKMDTIFVNSENRILSILK